MSRTVLPPVWTNPFPGLRPFDEEDADLFFGRETQVRELLTRMESERFLAVVGLSGSGKSSLVRAGLIPALRRGRLPGAGVRWKVATLRPGSEPFVALAAALNDPAVLGPSATRDVTLRASSFGLLHAGKEGRRPDQNLLVVVDQFEELFRLRSDGSARSNAAVEFVSLLVTAARDYRPDFATYVILTMRSDYLGDCAQFRGLPEALNRGQYLVPRLSQDDWYRALRMPAEQAGTPIDDQLLQRLMADAGDTPDQLPVLQHLLMRMWDLRDGPALTMATYAKAGGWNAALDQHLDSILEPFDAARRACARRVWQALTEFGERSRDSRRPARMSELMAVTGRTLDELAAVIEPFRAEGRNFLVSEDHPLRASSIVDISHESLIRRWKTLVGWASEEAHWGSSYKAVETEALSSYPERWKGSKLRAALEERQAGQWTAAWARRYARGEDDTERSASYAAATTFLDDSRDAQRAARIEAELERRWLSGWTFLPVGLAAALFLFVQPYIASFRWPFSILLELFSQAGVTWRDRLLEASWLPHVLAGTPVLVFYVVVAPYVKSVFERVTRARIRRAERNGVDLIENAEATATDVHGTTYATVWRRASAAIVDLAACLALFFVGLYATYALLSLTQVRFDVMLPLLLGVALLIGVTIPLVYDVCFWSSRRCASPGMRLAGIFITDLKGRRLTWLRATARHLSRVLSYYTAGLGFLIVFVRPWKDRRQTLHDRMARTVVLRGVPASDTQVPG